jgi:hypothetical protein
VQLIRRLVQYAQSNPAAVLAVQKERLYRGLNLQSPVLAEYQAGYPVLPAIAHNHRFFTAQKAGQ